MDASLLAAVLPTLLAELVNGRPDPATRTYVLNRGDPGLLASLGRLSAAAASATPGGGPSVAAHVDHLRYGLSLLNAWAAGALPPAEEIDWTASWTRTAVSEAEWAALRDALRREAAAWAAALRAPRAVGEVEAGWMAGSVAHVAYHLGAVRQLARAARGPTAEDEARPRRRSAPDDRSLATVVRATRGCGSQKRDACLTCRAAPFLDSVRVLNVSPRAAGDDARLRSGDGRAPRAPPGSRRPRPAPPPAPCPRPPPGRACSSGGLRGRARGPSGDHGTSGKRARSDGSACRAAFAASPRTTSWYSTASSTAGSASNVARPRAT
jgi:hypothetical protein